MDLEKMLRDKFKQINRAFFEEEFNSLFLRVEVNTTKLTEVEDISRQISDFLDANYDVKKEYFLDVYSKGSDVFFTFEQAQEHLGKHVKVELEKEIKGQDFLVGKLQAATATELELLVNNKGQIKKHLIEKSQIKGLSIFIKI